MRFWCNKDGYQKVKLYKTIYYVHRIVAQVFKPQPSVEEYEVDHIDGNPLNNHSDNLEWVTH